MRFDQITRINEYTLVDRLIPILTILTHGAEMSRKLGLETQDHGTDWIDPTNQAIWIKNSGREHDQSFKMRGLHTWMVASGG